MRRVEVHRTYLSLDNPEQLSRASRDVPILSTLRTLHPVPCSVPLYRRLYKEVGEQWYWHDRLAWSDERLAEHLASSDVGVWIVEDDKEKLVGYCELVRHANGSVEIAYFGLTPQFIGRGIGGWMLSQAVDHAWQMGAEKVWLHTCTLDSERALPNYIARGFVPYKTERLEVELEGKQVLAERLL